MLPHLKIEGIKFPDTIQHSISSDTQATQNMTQTQKSYYFMSQQ